MIVSEKKRKEMKRVKASVSFSCSLKLYKGDIFGNLITIKYLITRLIFVDAWRGENFSIYPVSRWRGSHALDPMPPVSPSLRDEFYTLV